MTIFVSIAAYRDPELIPTIRDCLRHARYPGDLRFGICWQHEAGDPWPGDDSGHIRVIDVPWPQSRGACWARAELGALYQGEAFVLQLDSHHRFVPGWDAMLLDQMERSGAARPLLTTYLPGYDVATPTPVTDTPTVMRLDRFTREGIATFGFGAMPDWAARHAPMRARFLSAHMLFTLGAFVTEVPYDPDLYFIGEEITLAARAFTHGYDLFHPSVHVAWHEYTRRGRPKHWDDHVAERKVGTPWHDRDAASRARAGRFLASPHIGPFGCGGARSFAEYEEYAGLDFRRRASSGPARRGEEPPVPPGCIAGGSGQRRAWTGRITLPRAALPAAAMDRPRFWYVGFHDANGIEIAREDATRAELGRLLSAPGATVVIERRFTSHRPPATWTIWPTDLHGCWQEKASGSVDAECLASAVPVP